MFKKLAIIVVLASGTAAQAATITENSGGVGSFSSNVNAPTVIGAGVTQIIGTGNANDFDLFRVDGLVSGAQSIGFDFSAPTGIGPSYAAGGVLRYSFSPFAGNAWTGGSAFASPDVNFFSPISTATLNLGAAFSGPLYLAMNFTYGSNLNYTVTLPAAPAAVPLPASGGLLFGVLGVAAFLRRRSGLPAA